MTFYIGDSRYKPIPSDRIDRWLGGSAVEQLSAAMRGSYFRKPIQVAMLDGAVRVGKDGDFVGRMDVGQFSSYEDWAQSRRFAAGFGPAKYQRGAITTRDSIFTAIGAGKKQTFNFSKAGVTGVANIANSLWDVGPQPQAGSTSAAPGGSSPTRTTTGGLQYADATGGDTMYFLGSTIVPNVGNNLLLIYDRFFQVNHSLGTDPQTVSGTPTLHQDSTAAGAFIGVAVTSALGAGTPTYEVTYVDQSGNAAEAATAVSIVGNSIARRFPFAGSTGNGWFIPLNGSDYGVRSITNLNLSATSTGNVDVFLGKPIAWVPMPIANLPYRMDGTLSPYDLESITASACIAFHEINKGATTATNYSGSISLLSA